MKLQRLDCPAVGIPMVGPVVMRALMDLLVIMVRTVVMVRMDRVPTAVVVLARVFGVVSPAVMATAEKKATVAEEVAEAAVEVMCVTPGVVLAVVEVPEAVVAVVVAEEVLAVVHSEHY